VRSSDFSGHLSRFINENFCAPKGALRRAGHHANTNLFHLRPELAERVGIEPTVPLPGQQFSRLPDSATLAPLHVIDLSDGRRTYGVDLSLLRSIVSQLTLGSVIFQLIFFDAVQNRQDCVETHMISYGFRRMISRMVFKIALSCLPCLQSRSVRRC
jgi:hypothetical protein